MDCKRLFPSELALIIGLMINSIGVPLMIHCGFGISTISSLSYVLSETFPKFSFGAWNYIFQTFLIVILIIITRKFKWSYIFSFITGITFGFLLDIFEPLINLIPNDMMIFNIILYFISFAILACGISLMVNSALPIIPTDIFPRDLSYHYNINFKVIKTYFDLVCLLATIVISIYIFHKLVGIGAGTVFFAFFTGKIVGKVNDFINRRYYFKPVFKPLNFFTMECEK